MDRCQTARVLRQPGESILSNKNASNIKLNKLLKINWQTNNKFYNEIEKETDTHGQSLKKKNNQLGVTKGVTWSLERK